MGHVDATKGAQREQPNLLKSSEGADLSAWKAAIPQAVEEQQVEAIHDGHLSLFDLAG